MFYLGISYVWLVGAREDNLVKFFQAQVSRCNREGLTVLGTDTYGVGPRLLRLRSGLNCQEMLLDAVPYTTDKVLVMNCLRHKAFSLYVP